MSTSVTCPHCEAAVGRATEHMGGHPPHYVCRAPRQTAAADTIASLQAALAKALEGLQGVIDYGEIPHEDVFESPTTDEGNGNDG